MTVIIKRIKVSHVFDVLNLLTEGNVNINFNLLINNFKGVHFDRISTVCRNMFQFINCSVI